MENQIVLFEETALVEFGNKALRVIFEHELRKEAAEQEIANATQRESVINVELMKAAMAMHENEMIDVYQVFGDKTETSSLYRAILKEMGVLEQKIVNDKVEYHFVDPQLEGAYEFEQKIASYKQGEEEEKPKYTQEEIADHKQRRSRRNSLNMRLQSVCKAAVSMLDSKATVADIAYREKDDGTTVAVLTKGPKDVMGSGKEIELTAGPGAKKAEKASHSPTITGLAKSADVKHKEKSKQTTETGKKSDAPKSEEEFISLLNVTLMTVKQREGEFSESEKTAMKNLLTELQGSVKK